MQLESNTHGGSAAWVDTAIIWVDVQLSRGPEAGMVGTQVRQTRLKLGKTQIVRVHPCMLKYMLQLSKVQRGREGDREGREKR